VNQSQFDTERVFDQDYLHFYADWIGDERSEAETDLIWRLLELEPAMEVLDLACGHGRIANRLAARGARVTGMDSSALFLTRARQAAAAAGVEVAYLRGDMRQLPLRQRFDRVVNWFTAYGYFDDVDNRRVLAEVARVLRPGGRFLLELNNYSTLMRDFLPAVVVRQGDDLLVDDHRFDPLTGRNMVERIVVRDGRVRRVPYFVRLFTFPELRDWLLQAGFTKVSGYGEDGAALTAEHRRMLVVAIR